MAFPLLDIFADFKLLNTLYLRQEYLVLTSSMFGINLGQPSCSY